MLVVALGPDQVDTKPVKGENFSIQTIFTEGTFLSSGILEFPPDSFKPTRNSSKHVLVRTLLCAQFNHPLITLPPPWTRSFSSSRAS